MQEFEARALIPAEPALNVADLLAQRVQRAPEAALFARPDGDGWRDVSGAAFLRRGGGAREGLRRGRHRPRGADRPARLHPLRVDARRLRRLVRRRVRRADLRDERARAGALDPRRLRLLRRDRGDGGALHPRGRGARRPRRRARGVAARARRPRQARRGRPRRHRRGDRAPPAARHRERHRDDHLHRGHDRAAEGLRAHARQLRRAGPQHDARHPRGRERGRVDAPLHHARARVRPVHRRARRARRREGRPPGRHLEAAARARLVPADLPARRAAGVREGLQLRRAEGGGGRQGEDLPLGRRHRHRLLRGAGRRPRAGRPLGPVRRRERARVPRRSARRSAAASSGRSPDPRPSASGSATSTGPWA